MVRDRLLLVIALVFVLNFSILSAEEFGYNLIEPESGGNVSSVTSANNCITIDPTTGNVVIIFNLSCSGFGGGGTNNSNTSEIWITSIGNLDNVNTTQFENNGGFLSIIPSWLTSFIESFGYTTQVFANDTYRLKTNHTFNGDVLVNGKVNITGNLSVNDSLLFVDSSTGKIGIGTTTDLLDIFNVNGSIDLIHLATISDDHAFEIDINADGFGDVKAIFINYITGAIVDGQDEEVILINIDDFQAIGGDVVGLEVISTEGGSMIIGLEAGVLVHPIEQLSGTFEDMDSALNVSTDVLAYFISTSLDATLFQTDNSNVTIGNAVKFEEIEFILETTASNPGIKPTFEYSTGVGTWDSFTPSDGTNGLRNTGVILWLDSDIPSWATGVGSEYLIRITRTANNLMTDPIEDKVQIASAIEYHWDKNGDLKVNNISATNVSVSGFFIGDGSNLFNIITNSTAWNRSATDVFLANTGDNVGIGTSTPQRNLHVESGVPTIRLSDSNAGTNQAVATLIEFYRGNIANRVGFLGMASSSNDDLRLSTDYPAGQIKLATGSDITALTIDSSQNVGIGTSTPQNKLNVIGDGNFTGNLTIGEKISFAFGEIIDNIIDGFVRVNGNLNVTGNISLKFGDLVSEQNPDSVDAIRIKATSSDVDVVLGDIIGTGFFSVWNAADDTPVFFVNNVGDTDILGDLTIGDDIFIPLALASSPEGLL